ncbi:hypothetical protein [Streptomyces sp. NPDC015350]|uniref:hypothetical protein n=1 Tax=Streptomyces sp. NPDC015350 TaxID=3364955 RepID=UPI003702CC74
MHPVPVRAGLDGRSAGAGPSTCSAASTATAATAREALPELREPARDEDPGHRVDVAAALWSAGGEQDLVLSVLSEGLAGERRLQRYDALRTISRMGTGAAGLLPALRGLWPSPEKSGGWVAGTLAVALWQVGREPDESVPALLHAWSEHWGNRLGAAEAWARTVSAAAPAVPLLRQELASARRHDNTGGRGRNRYRCADDERLLRHGRAVIAVVGS